MNHAGEIDSAIRRIVAELSALHGGSMDGTCSDLAIEIDRLVEARINAAVDSLVELARGAGVIERAAEMIAHRACIGAEHDPQSGKLHGCCVVCGVPWPCAYVKRSPRFPGDGDSETYTDTEGTLRNADGSRSIFDDVDE